MRHFAAGKVVLSQRTTSGGEHTAMFEPIVCISEMEAYLRRHI
eukprot:COSAG03_NODE_27784_length_251_cov_0.677632_1_plen_42_part_10